MCSQICIDFSYSLATYIRNCTYVLNNSYRVTFCVRSFTPRLRSDIGLKVARTGASSLSHPLPPSFFSEARTVWATFVLAFGEIYTTDTKPRKNIISDIDTARLRDQIKAERRSRWLGRFSRRDGIAVRFYFRGQVFWWLNRWTRTCSRPWEERGTALSSSATAVLCFSAGRATLEWFARNFSYVAAQVCR